MLRYWLPLVRSRMKTSSSVPSPSMSPALMWVISLLAPMLPIHVSEAIRGLMSPPTVVGAS